MSVQDMYFLPKFLFLEAGYCDVINLLPGFPDNTDGTRSEHEIKPKRGEVVPVLF
jgi:hypothetical protein